MRYNRKGYAIETSYQKYYATNGEETIDVAQAKVCLSQKTATSMLEKARARFPGASLIEVTIGSDSQGRQTINGFPKNTITSKRAIRRAVWNKYGGRCAYCGAEIELRKCHMDAYYPDKGLIQSNMMPACDSCYGHKKGKTPAEFQAYIESCMNSVKKNHLYKTAKRYGMVIESPRGVSFYYLRPEANIKKPN